jgi:3-hydroxyisobutyrate dehydrogenase-like beta-hydroxyacid dehydrogenase
MTVGFIGLGRMGAPMAARVGVTGHRVLGYDVSPARQQLGIHGVIHCANPAEVAKQADIVITCLPGPPEVADVVYGANGLLASLRPDAILVETSTISPEQSRTIARDLATRKVLYLDAPISGGVRGARDGTLVAMVGGPKAALEQARPILSSFAKDIFHLGPAGAGNVMKLVIQSIFLSQMASFLEAVSMGERSGIPLDTLLNIVEASSAHHPAIGTRYGMLKTGDLDPMFEVGSAVKDLSLAAAVWRALDGPLPMLESALSDYKGAAAEGFAQADLIAIRNWLGRKGT